MKLENQVCTLEQAKRLKELGVEQCGFFAWCPDGEEDEYAYLSPANGDGEGGSFAEDDEYSAFTVAELGVMLPEMYVSGHTYKRASCVCCYYKEAVIKGSNERYEKWQGKGNTEAQARAAMLIYLLENGHTTAEEVNQRLTN